ncbi:hypothetical protein EYB45_00880 [Erythrobacteraceae bacterium CFH 75059]|nr:hypothetical protein EYB45_00880 [Erythrobacteraceae bacterium CFH 75059]
MPMRAPPPPPAMNGLSAMAAAPQEEALPSRRDPEHEGRILLSAADAAAAARQGLIPADVRSVLDVRERMRHGQFVWQDNGRVSGRLVIWADLDRQLVSAFLDGHEIGTSVILYGTEGKATPEGSFPIKDKRERYHSRTYDAPMPYSLWLTDDGVAVHGSDVRWGRATHGCIGVPLAFARRLFAVAEPGDVVTIVRSSAHGTSREPALPQG